MRQDTGERQVVQVVTRPVGQRAITPPAGHAGVHEPVVEGPQLAGTQPEALGHPRSEPLHDHVRPPGELQDQLDSRRGAEVHPDRGTVAAEHVPRIAERRAEVGPTGVGDDQVGAGPDHPEHVGTEVRQDHARERGRPQTCEFDDPQASQRAGPFD